MALLVVHKVGQTLRPGVFEFDQNVDELRVVLELRVNHLDVLLVFLQ